MNSRVKRPKYAAYPPTRDRCGRGRFGHAGHAPPRWRAADAATAERREDPACSSSGSGSLSGGRVAMCPPVNCKMRTKIHLALILKQLSYSGWFGKTASSERAAKVSQDFGSPTDKGYAQKPPDPVI